VKNSIKILFFKKIIQNNSECKLIQKNSHKTTIMSILGIKSSSKTIKHLIIHNSLMDSNLNYFYLKKYSIKIMNEF